MRSLVVIGVAFSLVACGEVPEETANAEPAAPPVEVSSVDLAKAFDENEVAAKQTYGAAPLLVSGTVEGITLDFMDEPVVQLTGINEFQQVQASFEGDATAAAAQLKKGQSIALLCKSVGEVVGSPMLEDCTIQ